MNKGQSRRHHYVPQFYLRRFACADDAKKVRILERHGDMLVADRKSIDRIGYEESMHDFIADGIAGSIEGPINRVIETPFANGPTWRKITEGRASSLDETDKIAIYGFARHLQRRNLETLRFIEVERDRFRSGALDADLSAEERELHEWIAASADGAHSLFREGAMNTSIPDDAAEVNVMVCHSPIPLRTSTNPTLFLSERGRKSAFGAFFNDLRTWWLPLDRHWGAFIVAGGPPGFSNHPMPAENARMVNRQYLVQHGNGLTVRYVIAEDAYLDADLEWAGYLFDRPTTHGGRWRKSSAAY